MDALVVFGRIPLAVGRLKGRSEERRSVRCVDTVYLLFLYVVFKKGCFVLFIDLISCSNIFLSHKNLLRISEVI